MIGGDRVSQVEQHSGIVNTTEGREFTGLSGWVRAYGKGGMKGVRERKRDGRDGRGDMRVSTVNRINSYILCLHDSCRSQEVHEQYTCRAGS